MAGGGGASVQGPWFNGDGTYNSKPRSRSTATSSGRRRGFSIVRKARSGRSARTTCRRITTPATTRSPRSDDAYQYDRIPPGSPSRTWPVGLPGKPLEDATASAWACQVGAATNGVEIYNAFDALHVRTLNAWESPGPVRRPPEAGTGYHYHSIPACSTRTSRRKQSRAGRSFAFDGFPIYGPRGKDGKVLTNKDLDVCHGTTSKVKLDGKKQRIYHYVATKEFPYAVGCFRGTTSAPGSPG